MSCHVMSRHVMACHDMSWHEDITCQGQSIDVDWVPITCQIPHATVHAGLPHATATSDCLRGLVAQIMGLPQPILVACAL